MSVIKKFFQKRKLDIKFKRAGEGHALNEERLAPRPSGSPRGHASVGQSRVPGEEARRAAEAALARQTSREKDRQGTIALFDPLCKDRACC